MNIREYINLNLVRSILVILIPVMHLSAQQEWKQQEEKTKETKEVLEAYEDAFLQKDLDRLMALYSARSHPVWTGLRNLEEDLQCPGSE